MRIAGLLAVFLLVSTLRAQRPVVLLTDAPDLRASVAQLDALRAAGLQVAVIAGPGAFIGTVPDERAANTGRLEQLGRLLSAPSDERALAALPPAHALAAGYLTALLAGRFDAAPVRTPMRWSDHPDHGHALAPPVQERFDEDWACTQGYNSERMTGTVVAEVFFVESNGTVDPDLYNWTPAAVQQVEQQVIDAWSIWSHTAALNGITLTAVMEWYEPGGGIAAQGYEPITRPSSQDNLWIGAIMQNLGRTESSVFAKVDGFDHDRRAAVGAEHAVTTFIAYNPPEQNAPNQFTDGKIGYAYLGGPYMQLLYKANGWSTSQVNRVYGHELCHLFHAFDEYSSSGAANCTRSFNGRQNLNFQGSTCGGNQACVMVDNSFTGSGADRRWNLCPHTPYHIGWSGTLVPPTCLSPVNDVVLYTVPVKLKWDRGGPPASTSCYVRVRRRDTGATVYCGSAGAVDSLQLSLLNGPYDWSVSVGNPNDANGYAGITSVLGLFTVNAPLQAALAVSPSSTCAGSAVTFSDHSTGAPVAWGWSFPGGTPALYNGTTPPPITYATPGTYTATLTITDAGGGTSTATRSITITGGAAVPYTQDFNGGSFPPTGWSITGDGGQGGGLNWTADVASGCDPLTSALVDAFGFTGTFASPVLTSPLIDLSATSIPYVCFRYSYARESTTNTETLSISANDCAYQVNVPLLNSAGEALATNGGAYVAGQPWQPLECTDWRDVVIRLDALRGRVGRIQFRVNTTGGQNLFLDDVRVFDGVRVPLRVLLEGPYDSTTHRMNDALRAQHRVPLAQPYSAQGFVFAAEGGNETMPANADTITGPDAIVDWVVVEVRDALDPAHVIASRAALVQRDGDVVDSDGSGPVRMAVTAGDYFVSVRHRAHLGAMTATPVALANGMPVIDLSDPATATWGSGARKMVGDKAVLWMGDATGDGVLKYAGADNDRDPILYLIGGTVPTNTVNGYYREDCNMDGVVKYTGAANDRDPILLNVGGPPTNVRMQQLP